MQNGKESEKGKEKVRKLYSRLSGKEDQDFGAEKKIQKLELHSRLSLKEDTGNLDRRKRDTKKLLTRPYIMLSVSKTWKKGKRKRSLG